MPHLTKSAEKAVGYINLYSEVVLVLDDAHRFDWEGTRIHFQVVEGVMTYNTERYDKPLSSNEVEAEGINIIGEQVVKAYALLRDFCEVREELSCKDIEKLTQAFWVIASF